MQCKKPSMRRLGTSLVYGKFVHHSVQMQLILSLTWLNGDCTKTLTLAQHDYLTTKSGQSGTELAP